MWFQVVVASAESTARKCASTSTVAELASSGGLVGCGDSTHIHYDTGEMLSCGVVAEA